MRPALHLARRVALAVGLCALGGAASAQGTAEQQEACAPDAFKFCSGTIPDIAKTTACMKAHKAELSGRCQAAFNDATEKAPAAAAAGASQRRRTAHAAAPDTRDEGHRRRTARAAPAEETGDGGYRRHTARAPARPDIGDDDDRRDVRAAPYGADPGDDYGRRDDADMRPEGPEGPDDPAPYEAPPPYAGPPAYDGGPRQARGEGDRARASDEIDRLCADGMMDPRTCDVTERALGAGQ